MPRPSDTKAIAEFLRGLGLAGEKLPLATKTEPQYLYHTTYGRNLPGIQEQGLLPAKNSSFASSGKPIGGTDSLFFADEAGAKEWGSYFQSDPLVLRVDPKRFDFTNLGVDPHAPSSGKGASFKVGTKGVGPEHLEAWNGEKWVGLDEMQGPPGERGFPWGRHRSNREGAWYEPMKPGGSLSAALAQGIRGIGKGAEGLIMGLGGAPVVDPIIAGIRSLTGPNSYESEKQYLDEYRKENPTGIDQFMNAAQEGRPMTTDEALGLGMGYAGAMSATDKLVKALRAAGPEHSVWRGKQILSGRDPMFMKTWEGGNVRASTVQKLIDEGVLVPQPGARDAAYVLKEHLPLLDDNGFVRKTADLLRKPDAPAKETVPWAMGPMRGYHGTPVAFDRFQTPEGFPGGFSFAVGPEEVKDVARRYSTSSSRAYQPGAKPRVITADLEVRNPFVVTEPDSIGNWQNRIEELRAKGHDAIAERKMYMTSKGEVPGWEISMFDDANIKQLAEELIPFDPNWYK